MDPFSLELVRCFLSEEACSLEQGLLDVVVAVVAFSDLFFYCLNFCLASANFPIA
jgi:hypothetical protein